MNTFEKIYEVVKSIPNSRFTFPKSLYSVHDTIRFFVANKPDALIVDFFAGSGTTLHAVNLLNAVDKGHRRCVMVTNNEVSSEEAESLIEQGYYPGDDEWNNLGIARHVTWPRTVCSIKGVDVNGKIMDGNYGIEEEELSLGGEKSGHIIFRELSTTGDGVLTGIKVAELVKMCNKKLSELCDSELYPQVNIDCIVKDKVRIINNESVQEEINIQEKYLGEDSRIMVRVSGTENKIRVMCESKDLAKCQYSANEIARVIKAVNNLE